MLLHLEGMKEENYNKEEFDPDKWEEIDKQMYEHKDKFFSLFSNYFFTLWDWCMRRIKIWKDAIKVARAFRADWDEDPSTWILPEENEIYEKLKEIMRDK